MLHKAKKLIGVVILSFMVGTAKGQVCHTIASPAEDQMTHARGRHKQDTDIPGLAATANYDMVFQRLSVALDPAVRYISGHVTSYFKPLPSLDQMAFDLTDSLSLDSVFYHGLRLNSFTHSHNAVTIAFGTTLSALDSVTVYYHGAPPYTGFGSFNTGVHDTVVPVLWTLSEPYGSRDWFPGKMTLTDKIDSLDCFITIPVGNRAASNGLLVDTLQSGNKVTYHWQHRYPIANYLVGVAVTNYDSYAITVPTQYGNIYMLNYCYPENRSQWQQSDTNTMHALQLYSDLFGTYPFIKEKYGQAQFNWGGGMEHQTMSFIAGPDFELINHEMAHQWFGDKLTCGSWADIWLNEGFAVYLSALCYERLAPEWWMAWRRSNLSKVIRYGATGSVYCQDTTSVPRIFNSALSYAKGGHTLHMLRWELGDSVFFSALRNYVSDTSLTYSFSKTALLQQHLEQQSGRNLDTFFKQWFYGNGYPSYELDWAQQGNMVTAKLYQTTTDNSVPFYHMHVPVKFYGNDRDSTIVIDHSLSGQALTIAMPFEVDSVNIDPELWLVSGINVVRKMPALNAQNYVSVYPNPFSDQTTIWYDARNMHKAAYAIYDLQGKKVMEEQISTSVDHFPVTMDGLAQGVYILKFNSDKGIFSQRIVKY